jgi:hypothetical protein
MKNEGLGKGSVLRGFDLALNTNIPAEFAEQIGTVNRRGEDVIVTAAEHPIGIVHVTMYERGTLKAPAQLVPNGTSIIFPHVSLQTFCLSARFEGRTTAYIVHR